MDTPTTGGDRPRTPDALLGALERLLAIDATAVKGALVGQRQQVAEFGAGGAVLAAYSIRRDLLQPGRACRDRCTDGVSGQHSP